MASQAMASQAIACSPERGPRLPWCLGSFAGASLLAAAFFLVVVPALFPMPCGCPRPPNASGACPCARAGDGGPCGWRCADGSCVLDDMPVSCDAWT
jgi:hypothetical protein